MTFYEISANNEHGSEWVTNIKEEDVVVTVAQEDLKYITLEYARKIKVEDGDKVDSIDGELLEEAEYARALVDDYIDLDAINNNALYFDSWSDVFYTADDIRGWDMEEVIYDHDGQNFRITSILNCKNIEVEHIWNKEYSTGNVDTLKIKTGEIIKVDNSYYQGSRDTVEEGREYLTS